MLSAAVKSESALINEECQLITRKENINDFFLLAFRTHSA